MAQHAKLAKDSDAASVAPFVVDALGAIGAQAKELLQWLASAAVESRATTSEKTFMKMATTVMAVAIQRGNAALISSELPRQRALLGARKNRAARAAAILHATVTETSIIRNGR